MKLEPHELRDLIKAKAKDLTRMTDGCSVGLLITQIGRLVDLVNELNDIE